MVVARSRRTKRFAHEGVVSRLADAALPYDERAEEQAVGAVLLAPQVHAKRLVMRAYAGHFYMPEHGWWWEQMGLAVRRSDWDGDRGEWLARMAHAHRRRFGGPCYPMVLRCVNCFWWHAHWYIDRVIEVAKVRAKIVTASEALSDALDAADAWRASR